MRTNGHFIILMLVFLIVPLAFISCKGVAGDKSLRVARVINGHTIELNTKQEIRLLGVDTLLTYDCLKLDEYAERLGKDKKLLIEFGRKSVRFTEKLCKGKKVRLEYGLSEQAKDDRVLAYVYLPNDKLLNEEIILQGYGFVDLKSNQLSKEMLERFKAAENKAQAEKTGLWGEGLGDSSQ